jgi:ribose transport system ATP-binding protein
VYYQRVPDHVLEMRGIRKVFPGVVALGGVDFALRAGEVHVLLGENGAGKSTLIKIMAGVVQPDSGAMELEGRPVRFRNPAAATAAGIACIFQELSLLPHLTVADNISITNPPRRFGLIDRQAQRRIAEKALARAGAPDIDSHARVMDLPLSRRQMVEIAKALGRDPKLLILDEATSALTAADVEKVYEILARLRKEGLAILYISHRMHEIEALADVCSVFRNGQHIETFAKGTKSDDEVVELMIGREYRHVFPAKPVRDQPPPRMLEVERLSWGGVLHDVSLSVGRGEIVGIGGLDGQGQRELLLALFGVLRGVGGTIKVDGRPVRITSPKKAKSAGLDMALIPEDRKGEGLMLPMSVGDNISMASIGQLTKGIVVDRGQEERRVDEMVRRLAIKVGDLGDPAATLSGGNQQKVVIAKWLMTNARIVLLNDPTRGIDVGTKQEMYQLLRELADAGTAILFYTTDYDELIGCCDRVAILYGGRIVRELEGAALNEHDIVASSLNLPLEAQRGTLGASAS